MNNPAFQVGRLAFLLIFHVLILILQVTLTLTLTLTLNLTLTIPSPTRVMMTSPREILAWSYRVLELGRTEQRE